MRFRSNNTKSLPDWRGRGSRPKPIFRAVLQVAERLNNAVGRDAAPGRIANEGIRGVVDYTGRFKTLTCDDAISPSCIANDRIRYKAELM